jgi:hypothetical protein
VVLQHLKFSCQIVVILLLNPEYIYIQSREVRISHPNIMLQAAWIQYNSGVVEMRNLAALIDQI